MDTTPQITISSNGVYSVLVSDSLGCVASDTIIVSLSFLPLVDIGNDQKICPGESLILDAGSDWNTYLWSDSSTLQTFEVDTSGLFYVTVTDSNSCTSTDSVLISLKSSVSFNMPGDTSVCPGDSVFIDIPGFASYLWSDSVTDSALFLTAGNYQLTVSDSVGCTNVDSINVTESSIVINDLGPDQTICSNQSLALTAGPANGTYLWQDSSVLNTILVSDSGLYSVDVIDSNGCSSNDSVLISYFNSPALNIGSDTAICPNSSYVITLSGFNFYLWQDATTLPFYNITDSGEYSVEVYDLNACVWRDTITVRIDTSLAVDIKQDTSICFGDTVYLDAQNAGFAFKWQDGSSSQTLAAVSEGSYSVTVTDTLNCQRSDSMYLGVLDPRIYPNENILCLGDSLRLRVDDIPLASTSLEDFTMLTSAYFSHITLPTQSGKIYVLKVGGSYSTESGELRDAAYIYQQSSASIAPIDSLGFLWNGFAQLPVNANAYPNYSSSHEYEFVFSGNGLVQLITFSDNDYSDNGGSLNFTLYEIGGSVLWSNSDTSYYTMVKPSFNMQYSVIVENGHNVCHDTVKVAVSNMISNLDSTINVQCYNESNGRAYVQYNSGYGPYDLYWLDNNADTVYSSVNIDTRDSFVNFIQGSYVEGFPNAVLESCSVGTPVVAINCPGGTKEIIEHATNGFLVVSDDDFILLFVICLLIILCISHFPNM